MSHADHLTADQLSRALNMRDLTDPAQGQHELIVAPGLVYRRDAVDRSHVGEPHQVDLWRLRSTATTDEAVI